MFGRSVSSKIPRQENCLPGRETPVSVADTHLLTGQPMKPPYGSSLETAVFAMGCFWGAERRFWEMEGVVSTAVGYAGGYTPNPTYEETCTGLTGHTEVVLVIFDPSVIGFQTLLAMFWESHNPTQGMRQGNDMGTQYRSAIYCSSAEQLDQALGSASVVQDKLTVLDYGEITTEIMLAPDFFYAEDYHQQYLAKNPMAYCGLLPKPLIKVSE